MKAAFVVLSRQHYGIVLRIWICPLILYPLPPQFEDSRPQGPRVKLLHDQQERRAARDDDLPCQATI
jgi:hypothetical protein